MKDPSRRTGLWVPTARHPGLWRPMIPSRPPDPAFSVIRSMLSFTSLFADIKDSTELIKDLDPEDVQKLLDPAIHNTKDTVLRFEGIKYRKRFNAAL